MIKAIPPPDPAARASPGSRRPLSCASLIAPMMQQPGGQQQGRQGTPPHPAQQEAAGAADQPARYATRSKRSLEAAEGIEQGPALQGESMHTVIPCWPGIQSSLAGQAGGKLPGQIRKGACQPPPQAPLLDLHFSGVKLLLTTQLDCC